MVRVVDLRRTVVITASLAVLVPGAILVAALVALAGTVSVGRELSTGLVPAAAAAAGLLRDYAGQQSLLRDYVTGGQPAALAALSQATAPVPGQQARVAALVGSYPRMPGELAAAEAAYRAWVVRVAAPQLAAASRGDFTRARALQADITANRPYALAVRNTVAALQMRITSVEAAVTARLTAGQRLLVAVLIADCGIVALVALGAVVAVRRWLLLPVAVLRRAVASGRYDTPVPAVGSGELAGLGRATEMMRSRLVTALTEARFTGLLEAAPDAVVCVNGDGRIELVNAQAERLFGYGREELVGQPVELLLPAGVRDAHPAHRARYLADPRPHQVSAGTQPAGRCRDGATFPAEISLSATGTAEGTLVIAVIRDVTERLESVAERERLNTQIAQDTIERRRDQSQRMESLGQLASGVAHDFNNLLGVITNYAAFVSEDLAGQAGSQGTRDDVAQIQQAARRAAELTRQLLTFARQEDIQPRSLDLNEVVVSVEQLLGRTLGEHIELVTYLADDLDPVLADAGQMEQVLVNLAVNARDAMPAGGKLIIATTAVAIDGSASGNVGEPDLAPGRYVAVKVSDTGTGIPKELLDRVFEPFFSTKRKGEGTGLGLATVYGIVSRAGGGVRVYSEPGMGTVFTILLPVTTQAADIAPPQAAQPQRGHGETVLIVEDEHAIREVTRRILARNGYLVTATASGHEAIQAVTSQLEHVDVLLTDVVMPQMQGRELADKIRILRPKVRVIFMSGHTQGLLGQQGILDPGVHLIEKPFTETGLLAKISEILRPADDT